MKWEDFRAFLRKKGSGEGRWLNVRLTYAHLTVRLANMRAFRRKIEEACRLFKTVVFVPRHLLLRKMS